MIEVNWNENDYKSSWDLYTENIKRNYVKKYLNRKNGLPPSSHSRGLYHIEELRLRYFKVFMDTEISEKEMIGIGKSLFTEEQHNWGMETISERSEVQ